MGRVKSLAIDQEYYANWLDQILDHLKRTDKAKSNPYLKYCIRKINDCIMLLGNGDLHSDAILYLNNEKQNIDDIVSKIWNYDETKDWPNILLSKITVLINKLDIPKIQLYNEDFYKNKIESLESEKKSLTQELSDLSNQHDKEKTEKQTQIVSLQNEIKEKETLLKETKKQYEEAKSQVEAQNNINVRITTSFLFLTQKSRIIEMERKRLNIMYYAYVVISIFILLCFFLIECVLWCRVLNEKSVELFYYIRFFLPVPLCTGLLWFSVYQMNRVHRLLLNIADKLHNIRYVEGLLLAVNNLSLDANDGLKKVQNILDQVVEKYLHQYDMLSDTAIDKSLAKDTANIDVEKVVKFLKEIKKVVS